MKRHECGSKDFDRRIYPASGYEDEEGFQELITKKINEIQDHRKKTTSYEVINKRIDPSFTYRDINDLLVDIYVNRKNAFKVNLGFGFILYHTVYEEYKYHYVSNNNLLFENAVLIRSRKDISDLMKHIVSLDLETNFYLKKPSSNWILAGLTNIEVLIIDLKRVSLG